MEGEGDFDMLYHYGSLDDIWLGNWGFIRTFEERVPHLIPLPDRQSTSKEKEPLPKPTGKKPPMASNQEIHIRLMQYVRKYDVVAYQY